MTANPASPTLGETACELSGVLLMAMAVITAIGTVVAALFHAGTTAVALAVVTATLALTGALLIVISTGRQSKRARFERRRILAELKERRPT